MKFFFACAAAAVFLVCLCADAQAHRVNIFAFIDGDRIRVDCGFSRSQKVKNGRIAVTDAATGALILAGTTDGHGQFDFRPPGDFLRSGHGLTIALEAGEGHRNDWTVSASELQALAASPSPAAPAPPEKTALPAPDSAPLAAPGPGGRSGLNEQALEAIIERALDAKLAPVNHALAQLREREPDVRDIVGGIGWILGLIGLAAYIRSRRA